MATRKFSTTEGSRIIQVSCATVLQEVFANCNLGIAFLDTTSVSVDYDIRHRVFRVSVFVSLFNLMCRVDYTNDYVEDRYLNNRIDLIARPLGDRLEEALLSYIEDPLAFRERELVDSPYDSIEVVNENEEFATVPMIRMLRE
jgi:hypothetical protein